MGEKRRGRGEGSIERLPNGNYRAVLSFGVDPVTGKRRKVSRTFQRHRDAVEWRDKQKQDGPVSAALSLDAWLTTWLELHKAKSAASNYTTDRQTVEKHLRPHLGRLRLGRLDAVAVQRWLARLKEAGVTQGERHKAGRTLRKILYAAVDAGVLTKSPMQRVKIPAVPASERRGLNPEEVTALVEVAEARGLGAVVRLWLDTGLRPGEVLGLKWEDWDGRRVRVRRAVCRVTGGLKELKTRRSLRTIPVSADRGPARRLPAGGRGARRPGLAGGDRRAEEGPAAPAAEQLLEPGVRAARRGGEGGVYPLHHPPHDGYTAAAGRGQPAGGRRPPRPRRPGHDAAVVRALPAGRPGPVGRPDGHLPGPVSQAGPRGRYCTGG